MAVYAVGDVHGALPELKTLLDLIDFRASRDRLWFVGDLINRGPNSLETVRFVRDLGDSAITLMGNHEARAVAGLSGIGGASFENHFRYLIQAPDRDDLYTWLRHLPLLHHDEDLRTVMVHAGFYPGWCFADARERAQRLHNILRNDAQIGPFFARLKGFRPEIEPDENDEDGRLCFAFLVMTQIRLCQNQDQLSWVNPGLSSSGEPYSLAHSLPDRPWYELGQWDKEEDRVIYGHWAAAGMQRNGPFIGLDSGCVYGGKLSAVRLDHPDRPLIQIPCPCYVPL